MQNITNIVQNITNIVQNITNIVQNITNILQNITNIVQNITNIWNLHEKSNWMTPCTSQYEKVEILTSWPWRWPRIMVNHTYLKTT